MTFKVWACLCLLGVFLVVAAVAVDGLSGLDDVCIRRPEIGGC